MQLNQLAPLGNCLLNDLETVTVITFTAARAKLNFNNNHLLFHVAMLYETNRLKLLKHLFLRLLADNSTFRYAVSPKIFEYSFRYK